MLKYLVLEQYVIFGNLAPKELNGGLTVQQVQNNMPPLFQKKRLDSPYSFGETITRHVNNHGLIKRSRFL